LAHPEFVRPRHARAVNSKATFCSRARLLWKRTLARIRGGSRNRVHATRTMAMTAAYNESTTWPRVPVDRPVRESLSGGARPGVFYGAHPYAPREQGSRRLALVVARTSPPLRWRSPLSRSVREPPVCDREFCGDARWRSQLPDPWKVRRWGDQRS